LPPLKIFLLDNQKIFLGFGAEIAPSSLKMAAPLFTLSKGGGVQTVVFWSNLRPSYYAITGRGPAGPPLATALVITKFVITKFDCNKIDGNDLPD
jgi:hypothetical protein